MAQVVNLEVLHHEIHPAPIPTSADLPDTVFLQDVKLVDLRPQERKLECTTIEDFARIADTSIISFLPERYKDALPIPNTVYPWSEPLTELAPEDLATSCPSALGDIADWLDCPWEEAFANYKTSLRDHIAPEFAAAVPGLLDYMVSEEVLKVMLPREWLGLDFPPYSLETLPTLPVKLRAFPRNVNALKRDLARKELKRMTKYFYRPSTSPWASPCVIADKDGKGPNIKSIRVAGDYREINKHLRAIQWPIPNVRNLLERASTMLVSLDLDAKSAFHQIIIDERTSQLLAVQMEDGLYEPRFLPEGCHPASALLQMYVWKIFAGFEDWIIVIFDNFFVIAYSYQDAFDKLKKVMERMARYRMVLNYKKCWFGFPEVTFFGYRISNGSYGVRQGIKDEIASIPFFSSKLGCQQFLGATVFCQNFVPGYADLVAPLQDMTKKGFSWDKKTWTVDYEAVFESFKSALAKQVSLTMPDYSLEWIIQTDASARAAGGVLFQVALSGDKQPLLFFGAKFAGPSINWPIAKKEAYAINLAVIKCEHLIQGKPLVLETDHRNLVYIESSPEAITIRWKLRLQNFPLFLRDIKGQDNPIADWLSRPDDQPPSEVPPVTSPLQLASSSNLVPPSQDNPPNPALLIPLTQEVPPSEDHPLAKYSNTPTRVLDTHFTVDQALKEAHCGSAFHVGIAATWRNLNTFFAGHGLSYQLVTDYIDSCPTCQKVRTAMKDKLIPVYRTLRPEHQLRILGLDVMHVSPPSESGSNNLVMAKDQTTLYHMLFPRKDHTAESLTSVLFQIYARTGIYDKITTDPGSDFMADAVEQLNAWFGVAHKVSLVDRHQSNGAEKSIGLTKRWLLTLLSEKRLSKHWDQPQVIGAIEFHLNDFVNSETGVRPFDATFGTVIGTYHRLPPRLSNPKRATEYVRLLDETLALITELAYKHRGLLLDKRGTALADPRRQNRFQPGDLILFDQDKQVPKLHYVYEGPYEVEQQVVNDIHCKHLATRVAEVFHVDRVGLFKGSRQQAFEMACLDRDQYLIRQIVEHRGDALKRKGMEFRTVFADGDIRWLPYSTDISNTVPFEDYIRRFPELRVLLQSAKEALRFVTKCNSTPFASLAFPGKTFFLELRYFGSIYYDDITVPPEDLYRLQYFFKCTYTEWVREPLVISVLCHVPNIRLVFNGYDVVTWGHVFVLPSTAVLVDAVFATKHPEVLACPVPASSRRPQRK